MRLTTPTRWFYLHAAIAAAAVALAVAPCAAGNCNDVGDPVGFDPVPWTPENPSFNLAPACIGAPYSQTIVYPVPSTVTIQNVTIPVNALSIPTANGIENLPVGVTYECDPPNCYFPANSCLAVHLYGTPTQGNPAPATQDLIANGTLNTPLGTFPVALPKDLLPGSHFYLSLGSAGSCPTTTTSTTATTSSTVLASSTTATTSSTILASSTTATTSDVTTSTGATSTTSAATTTSTLPDPCLGAIAVSKLGLGCSLDDLQHALGATAGLGKPAHPLAGLIAAARDRLDRSANACAESKLAPARKQALRAAAAMKAFARKVRSRAARGAAAETRSALIAAAGHIEVDARTFAQGMTCPP